MARRPQKDTGPWQSFADLAMGMMAVLLLVVIVLVGRQAKNLKAKEVEAEALTSFFLELASALEEASLLQQRQDGVSLWVQHLFDETLCNLSFDPRSGKLTFDTGGDQGDSAELYQPGGTRLSATADAALESCRAAFQQLSACLSPDDKVRQARCRDAGDEKWGPKVDAFRLGIEALVLQGNTDRLGYRPPASVSGDHRMSKTARTFVANAYLGAERARQALGRLLQLVAAHEDATDTEAEDAPASVMLARLRVESPSFGRYQVGPSDWRAPEAEACHDGEPACAPARNLSLHLRFRQDSLRAPFQKVTRAFCKEWTNKTSQIRDNIESARPDEAARISVLCDGAQPSEAEGSQ